jgi:hypothetical protein
MRWRVALAHLVAAGCHGHEPAGLDAGSCVPACGDGQACRYDTCVARPTACTGNAECAGDQHCDPSAMECLPWGVGPGGTSDPACKNAPVPGVFFPGVQCEWLGPPAGDAFPAHVNVLATPMVATFGAAAAPSIVFTSYNFTDHQGESCIGSDPAYFGVIRVIDGATCQQQATIATPTVIATAPVAIADLGGDDATPEIVAARSQGGLVAFTKKAAGWQVLWETSSTFADALCDWAGPSIHDLDDDGKPEVIFLGAVYDGQTGAAIDESLAPTLDSVGVGYISVIADVDADGAPELVTGTALYGWDRSQRKWTTKRGLPGANGHVAVGDFGTYPASGQDDRSHTDGIAEIAVIFNGVARVFTVTGREVFTASLKDVMEPKDEGGPPIIADFDGDGRAELAAAGGAAYTVLDPDCRGAPDRATCASLSTDGVLWSRPSQGSTPNLTGSSAFDFDGDGRAEVAYSDACFTRLYDGATGEVLYSHARTSCTWFENPVIADVDGDFNAELITTSAQACGVSCPAVDPLFDGARCADDSDCPSATHCGRDQSGDALGRCRCALDADCGGGLVCRDPSAGPSPAGKVCRASHLASASAGVHVLADTVDRWVGARAIWNQHAYSVTNIDDAGAVPRTSRWLRNWTQSGLNTFRAGPPADPAGAHASPDLTVKQAKVTCNAGPPTVSAEVCNRGSEPVARGVPVAVYAATTPSKLRCQAQTAERLAPGSCTTVSCAWAGAMGDGAVIVDDRGTGTGIARECREDNNAITLKVSCPGPSISDD